MKTLRFFVLIFITLSVFGCKNKSHSRPNVTGSMGEMLMVMDDKWRNGPEGELMQSILRQPMEGLPQVESLFDLSITPHRAFSDNMKTFRNLIVTNISNDVEKEGVRYFTESAWAHEQAMIHISARTPEKFVELVHEQELRIVGFFIRAERQRSLRYYTRYINADLANYVETKWGLKMVIPNTFKGNKGSDTFSWMSHETSTTSQGLLIYSFDYVGEGTLSREYLLNKRDSVLRLNVPGPAEGSYMTSEHTVPITYKTLKVNDHNVVELRGLWKLVGDIMGGPFVLFAHHDKPNNRIVVTDSYVYSPQKPDKRNQIWQAESILYSVKFPGENVEEPIADEE